MTAQTHPSRSGSPCPKAGLTRRDFIKSSATGAAMMYMAPAFALASGTGSRVVNVYHSGLVTSGGTLSKTGARAGVDQAILQLTQKGNLKDAWQSVFPDLKSGDTIGLKVNCINRKCPTHPEIAYGIAESMIDHLGINPNRIIIWDRSDAELKKAGYTLNESGTGIRCFGTVQKFSIPRWLLNRKQDEEGGIGYDKTTSIDVGEGVTSHLSKILTQKCTWLINVPVLKDHRLAGVTLSMKNHYGSIDNPRDCHGDLCDPFIARMNAAPEIRDKTRLILCDAAFGVSKGGPRGAPDFRPCRILASFDPVALDYTGMQLINAKRKENNEDPVTAMAVHIRTAQSLGLGLADPKRIALKEVLIG